MRHLVTPLTLVLLAAAARAQVVCERVNENPAPVQLSTATSWFALKLTTTSPKVVTGAEFYLQSNGATQTTIGYYDEDTVTGKPLNLVASATATITPNVPAWYGAAFAAPIPVLPNTNYFVAVQLGNGITPGTMSGGQIVTHYWSPPTWSGPWPTQRWMYRVYCGSNAGTFSNFGAGKPGTGSFVPVMGGFGFPNIGNPVTLQLSSALGGAPAILLWGRQANISAGIGTIYCFPVMFTSADVARGTQPGLGYVNTELTLPLDPSLAGAQVAFQTWVPDAAAMAGVAHSDGLLMTVGN